MFTISNHTVGSGLSESFAQSYDMSAGMKWPHFVSMLKDYVSDHHTI